MPKPPTPTPPPEQTGRPVAYHDDHIRAAEHLAETLADVPARPAIDGDLTWQLDAVCATVDPELFHPAGDFDNLNIDIATGTCGKCPVRAACRQLRYDLMAVGSVWGGVYYGTKTRGTRPCLVAGCDRPVLSKQGQYCSFEHEHTVHVGTMRGYEAHRKASVAVCKPCREAKRENARRYRDPDAQVRHSREGYGGAPDYRRPGAGRRVPV
jgi:Transcription factor WhiB